MMCQASCAAGRTVSLTTRLSTKYLPASPPAQEDEHSDHDEPDPERAHLLAAPTTGEPDGADPAGDREDPDEVRDLLEPVRDRLRSVRSSDLRIVTCAEPWGILAARFSMNPNRSPSLRTSGRRSRTTLPFEVSSARVSPWSTFTNCACGRPRRSDERVLRPRPRDELLRGPCRRAVPRCRRAGRRAPGGSSGSLPSSSAERSTFALNASTSSAATCCWIAGLAISSCDVCLN